MTTTPQELPELKPCPFCGPELEVFGDGGLNIECQHHGLICIMCEGCGTRGPRCTTIENATATWNTRAPHPDNSAGEVVEGLDEAIEWMQLLQGPKDERLEPDQSKVQKVINAAKLWAAHQRKVGG